jgi:hypothetical protein
MRFWPKLMILNLPNSLNRRSSPTKFQGLSRVAHIEDRCLEAILVTLKLTPRALTLLAGWQW